MAAHDAYKVNIVEMQLHGVELGDMRNSLTVQSIPHIEAKMNHYRVVENADDLK